MSLVQECMLMIIGQYESFDYSWTIKEIKEEPILSASDKDIKDYLESKGPAKDKYIEIALNKILGI